MQQSKLSRVKFDKKNYPTKPEFKDKKFSSLEIKLIKLYYVLPQKGDWGGG